MMAATSWASPRHPSSASLCITSGGGGEGEGVTGRNCSSLSLPSIGSERGEIFRTILGATPTKPGVT